ncbi:MAG: hypothetical protein HY240_02500 [Actinobacteria bacterium]|nr:hypothetical protein [Actinomycetota bacterium]
MSQLTRARRLLAGALVAGALAIPIASAPAPACAAALEHAALVVDTGSAVTTYCVALPDGSVSGIGLIRLAADQYGLEYRLGYGGAAVCQLAGVGPADGDCFGGFPDYWGYWRGDGKGGWTWSNVGAADTTVGAGDVDGWAWGSGDDGGTHPRPPRTSFGDVCADSSPSPSAVPTSSGSGGTGGGPPLGGAAAPVSDSRSPRGEPSSKGSGKGSGAGAPTGSTAGVVLRTEGGGTAAPSTVLAAARGTTSGPPLGALWSLAAVGLLLGAAGVQRHRRRGDPP